MKKQIEHLILNTSEIKTLLENIKYTKDSSLIKVLNDLLHKDVQAIVIELEDKKNIFCDYIKISELEIYPISRKVIKNGEEIFLTPKEFDILIFLARNRGEVFTKEQIYNAVWEEDYLMDDSNIMAFIRKIRKKIETNPDDPQYILTIWGIGYKFSEK